MLIGGWTGLVLRRAAADRPLVASAALVILVASTVLVAAAGYPAAAAREGAVSRLLATDRLATAISVHFDVRPASIAAADAPVRAVLTDAMGSMGDQIATSGWSESYHLGIQEAGYPPSTKFAFADELDRHAHVSEGSWPTAGQAEIQAVVTPRAADRLGVLRRIIPSRSRSPTRCTSCARGAWKPLTDPTVSTAGRSSGTRASWMRVSVQSGLDQARLVPEPISPAG